jgi:hypothetical protein
MDSNHRHQIRSLASYPLDDPERWTPRRESDPHLHRGMVASLPLDNARMARTAGIEPAYTGFGNRGLPSRPDAYTTRSGPTPMGNAPFSGRAAGCSQVPSQVETVQMKAIGGLLPPHIRRGIAGGPAA